MDTFDMCPFVADHPEIEELYHEFFFADRFSVGLYELEPGTTDPQILHTEDEVYSIVSGLAGYRC